MAKFSLVKIYADLLVTVWLQVRYSLLWELKCIKYLTKFLDSANDKLEALNMKVMLFILNHLVTKVQNMLVQFSTIVWLMKFTKRLMMHVVN